MEKNKNVKMVFDKIMAPSNRELTSNQRISLASGGLVMTLLGMRNFRNKGWMFSLLGGALAYVGFLGKNPLYGINKKENIEPLKARASVKINNSRHAVYTFWRKLENLALFMDHIKEVKEITDQRSRWMANLNGVDLEWEAEITEDLAGEKISWRSLIISDVQNRGHVLFKDTPDMKGTEVTVELEYGSNAGKLAQAFAALYHPVFEKQVKRELNECKKLLEADEVRHVHSDNNV